MSDNRRSVEKAVTVMLAMKEEYNSVSVTRALDSAGLLVTPLHERALADRKEG
jgi:hypothetical protein